MLLLDLHMLNLCYFSVLLLVINILPAWSYGGRGKDEEASTIYKRQMRTLTPKYACKRGQYIGPPYDNLIYWENHSNSVQYFATEDKMYEYLCVCKIMICCSSKRLTPYTF